MYFEFADKAPLHMFSVNNDTEHARMGAQSIIFTRDKDTTLVRFSSVHSKFVENEFFITVYANLALKKQIMIEISA